MEDHSDDVATLNQVVKLEFSLLPRRCSKSKKSIWLQYAWRRSRLIAQEGSCSLGEQWVSQPEYLIMKLKGLV
jgi:hypothetical protein